MSACGPRGEGEAKPSTSMPTLSSPAPDDVTLLVSNERIRVLQPALLLGITHLAVAHAERRKLGQRRRQQLAQLGGAGERHKQLKQLRVCVGCVCVCACSVASSLRSLGEPANVISSSNTCACASLYVSCEWACRVSRRIQVPWLRCVCRSKQHRQGQQIHMQLVSSRKHTATAKGTHTRQGPPSPQGKDD